MEFKIEYDTILTIAEEEVSREASQAYSEDGSSLYDGLRMISRDEAKRKRMMSEVLVSIRILCNRLVKQVELEEGADSGGEDTGEKTSFYFNLEMSPRRAAGKGESLKTLFRSLTVSLFLNKYFASKNNADLASKYDAVALSDVQTIAKQLYEKLPPVYPTIVETPSDNDAPEEEMPPVDVPVEPPTDTPDGDVPEEENPDTPVEDETSNDNNL